jgi:polynucleotide 5'-hydroxyl-kinase GRC3/NOL9
MDVGKSTLCSFLSAGISTRWATARIDCDPGQSQISVPGTMALGAEPWDGGPPLAVWFLGVTSPVGHRKDIRIGVAKLAERAGERGFQKVVVDSWGYFEAAGGFDLQTQLLHTLRPDYTVAIQRDRELEPFLSSPGLVPASQMVRLTPSPLAAPRSQEQHRAYRRRRYAEHFRSAEQHRIPLDGLGVDGPTSLRREEWETPGRLIALCDRDGFAVAVGLVERWDWTKKDLQVFAPALRQDTVASIRIGEFLLDRGTWEERAS